MGQGKESIRLPDSCEKKVSYFPFLAVGRKLKRSEERLGDGHPAAPGHFNCCLPRFYLSVTHFMIIKDPDIKRIPALFSRSCHHMDSSSPQLKQKSAPTLRKDLTRTGRWLQVASYATQQSLAETRPQTKPHPGLAGRPCPPWCWTAGRRQNLSHPDYAGRPLQLRSGSSVGEPPLRQQRASLLPSLAPPNRPQRWPKEGLQGHQKAPCLLLRNRELT